MDPSEVRFARSGAVHVAFQTLGDGPVDLVIGRSAISHLGVSWESQALGQCFRDLAAFSRVILFDKRGVGLSDRDVGAPTLEERMDDIRAVMDAVGSKRAALFGTLDGAPLSILFAATYPERTSALVLWGGQARGEWAADYPWVPTETQWETAIQRDEREWGSVAHIDRICADLAPSQVHNAEFKRWLGRLILYGASPSAGTALAQMHRQIDVRPVLGAIHVPTLVLHSSTSRAVPVENGRFLAERIPGAKLVEVANSDHFFWTVPETERAVVGLIRRFLGDLPEFSETDRVLTTVLFADIVGSTERASALGDREWHRVLEAYLQNARTEVGRFRGRLVKTTGDGFVATFDGPTRAIRCAVQLRDHSRTLDLDTRSGLHTGECLLKEGDILGIAVHIASRVCDRAGASEVLVTSTVRDLSIGSDLRFVDRGTHPLRGVDGRWRVFSVGENMATRPSSSQGQADIERIDGRP
jgi:class 3 adenylate cyclase